MMKYIKEAVSIARRNETVGSVGAAATEVIPDAHQRGDAVGPGFTKRFDGWWVNSFWLGSATTFGVVMI
jgi:hypothetical protein